MQYSTLLSLVAHRLAAQLQSAGFDGLEFGWVDGIGLPRSCAQGALFHIEYTVQHHGDRALIFRWPVLLRLRQRRQSERQQILGDVHLRQDIWLLPIESDRRLLLA